MFLGVSLDNDMQVGCYPSGTTSTKDAYWFVDAHDLGSEVKFWQKLNNNV